MGSSVVLFLAPMRQRTTSATGIKLLLKWKGNTYYSEHGLPSSSTPQFFEAFIATANPTVEFNCGQQTSAATGFYQQAQPAHRKRVNVERRERKIFASCVSAERRFAE